MAEKAFKVPSLALIGSGNQLAVNAATNKIEWQGPQFTDTLAYESYVDNAVANVTVNVAALAGDYISYDAANNELDFNINAVAGSGIVISANKLAVDTSVFATKTYVDDVATGLDVKQSVRIATTGNITLSGEGTLEDGQGYASGDRVLVKNQTIAEDNGIYVVNKLGAWTRATDADNGGELTFGAFTFVEEGALAGKGFVYSSANTWTQFSEAGSFITSVEANGPLVVDTSNVLSLTRGNGLYVDSMVNGLSVNVNAIAGNGLIGYGGGLGNLAVNNGQHLSINATSGALQVNLATMAGYNLTVDGGNNTLSVNVASVSLDLTSGTGAISRIVTSGAIGVNAGTHLAINTATNALDVNAASITDFLTVQYGGLMSHDYGARSFFITSGSATTKTVVGTASTEQSNTWITVAEIDFNGTGQPTMFSADVVMAMSSKTRTSKISGTVDFAAEAANYTEYAIVEQGGTITGADVRVIYDAGSWRVQVQSEVDPGGVDLRGVASVTTVGYYT